MFNPVFATVLVVPMERCTIRTVTNTGVDISPF
jgi:hypothetical protein